MNKMIQKLMRRFFVIPLAAVVFPAAAWAVDAVPRISKASFGISSSTSSGSVYYNCDSLEDMTENMLKKLGANDVRVRCSGGLESGTYWGPASITASFSSPVLGSGSSARSASYKAFQLRDSDNCHAAQEIFAGLRSKLDLNSISGTKSFCDGNDSYRIQGNALMFN